MSPAEAPPPGSVEISSSSSSSSAQAVAPVPTDRSPASLVAAVEVLAVTSYNLEVHLRPAASHLAVVARMTLRNDGPKPLPRVALEVSGSLHWESVSVVTAGRLAEVPLARATVDTDADHTGAASEAVLTLPSPLAPGASLEISAIYSGAIARSATRLERIGVPRADARLADWDEIAPGGTFLRGFGNVLWYPVAAAPVFLGQGAALVQAAGVQRARSSGAPLHLRLAVESIGEAPDAAFFCGQRQPLTAHSENPDGPVASTPGIATAEIDLPVLGFHLLSLFVTNQPPVSSRDALLLAVTQDSSALPRFAAAAERVRPLLVQWLGTQPAAPLNLIDHPGQPWEEGTLLVLPMTAPRQLAGVPAGADADPALSYTLVQALAHAWFRSRHAWLDEGVAHLMQLLWIEQTRGRQQAVDQMEDANRALALQEAMSGSEDRSLPQAREAVFFHTKAADVLWMLRDIVGEPVLAKSFVRYEKDRAADADPKGFERVLEAESGKDLGWFFDDWVNHDRGLPDLSIVSVTDRNLVSGTTRAAAGARDPGSLVAVEVHNDGGAVAQVPITVRSGNLTATETLRIPAHASASTRVLFQGRPEEVEVNDGSVPEAIRSRHLHRIVAAGEPTQPQ